jgi:hypothetical protein
LQLRDWALCSFAAGRLCGFAGWALAASPLAALQLRGLGACGFAAFRAERLCLSVTIYY